MPLPAHGPRPASPARRRLRVLAWRARYPLAAVCAGLAVVLATERLRPPDPPSGTVTVAARDLAPGTPLTAADVAVRTVPVALVPGTGPPLDPTDLEGRRLVVAVPAGLVLAAELLVDDSSAPPAGTVVVPVRFADAGVAAVLRPGTRVDVVAAALVDGGAPERLARGALVLPTPTADVGAGGGGADGGPGSGGGLLGTGATADAGPVLLAVTPDEAVLLGGSASSRALGPVIVG